MASGYDNIMQVTAAEAVDRELVYIEFLDFSISFLGRGTPGKRSVSKNHHQRHLGNLLNRLPSRDFWIFVRAHGRGPPPRPGGSCTGGFFENLGRLPEAITFDLVVRITRNLHQMKI